MVKHVRSSDKCTDYVSGQGPEQNATGGKLSWVRLSVLCPKMPRSSGERGNNGGGDVGNNEVPVAGVVG